MRHLYLILFLSVFAFSLSAQIGVNTNFDIFSNVPIDQRLVMDNLADTSSVTWTYEGLLTYAKDVNQYWVFNGSFWERLTADNLATANITQDAEPRTYNANGENLTFSNVNDFGISATDDVNIFAVDSIFLQSLKQIFRNNTQDILQIDGDGVKILNSTEDNGATVLYGKDPITSEIVEVTDLDGFNGVDGATATTTIDEAYNNIGANSSKIFIDAAEGQTTGGLAMDIRSGENFRVIQNADESDPHFAAYLSAGINRAGFGTNSGTDGKVNIINQNGDDVSALYVTQLATGASSNGIRVLSRSESEPAAYFDMQSTDLTKQAIAQLAHWESGIASNWLYRDVPLATAKSPIVKMESGSATDTFNILEVVNTVGKQIIVDNAGDVGFGVEQPRQKVDVEGGIRVSDKIFFNDDNTYIGTAATNDIEMRTDGSMMFNIVSPGGTEAVISVYDDFKIVEGNLEVIDSTETLASFNSSNAFPSLRINGTVANTHPLITFRDQGTQEAVIGLDAAQSALTFGITSVNNDYAVMESDGDWGFGTGLGIDSSAIVEIQSTTKGFLIPRMNTSQRTLIGTPATGLQVYDTDTNSFWYYDGTEWLSHMRVNGDGDAFVLGNFGVGTTTPNEKLHIYNAANDDVSLHLENDFSGKNSIFKLNSGSSGDGLIQFAEANTIQAMIKYDGGTDLLYINNGALGADKHVVIDGTGNVGMGTDTPETSAILDLNSTTKGFLVPRMTTTERNLITATAGLIIFNTTTSKHQGYDGTAWNDFY